MHDKVFNYLNYTTKRKFPPASLFFFCLQCKGMGTGRPESNPPRRFHFRTTPIEKVRVGWLPVPLTSASDTGCQRFGSEPYVQPEVRYNCNTKPTLGLQINDVEFTIILKMKQITKLFNPSIKCKQSVNLLQCLMP